MTFALPFLDDFNRSNGAVANSWLYLTGVTNPVIASNVLAGCPASSAIQMTNEMTTTPDYVQITLGAQPATGAYVHVFCGSVGMNGTGSQPQTGVSFSQGDSNDYRIWTWVAGTPTQQSVVTSPTGTVMRLTKIGDLYTGWVANKRVITWDDTGFIASWGTFVGNFTGGGTSGAAGPTVDDFRADVRAYTAIPFVGEAAGTTPAGLAPWFFPQNGQVFPR